VVANAPSKLPTGVRAVLTMTISLDIKNYPAGCYSVVSIDWLA
jgi:hypothetical protein